MTMTYLELRISDKFCNPITKKFFSLDCSCIFFAVDKYFTQCFFNLHQAKHNQTLLHTDFEMITRKKQNSWQLTNLDF